MAETTDNGQGNHRTGVADVRAAIESAGKAKDESDANDSDITDDDDNSDDDGEGDDDGSDSTDDDTTNSDDASGDDEGEGDDDDAGNSDKSKSQSKGYKYQQYAGDGKPETYISNLEKAHQSSISNAVQLQTDLNQATGRVDAIMRAAASDPDLAKRLNEVINKDGSGTGDGGDNSDGGSAISNPFVADMEAQWRENSTKEIDEFLEANPEVATDPKIAADVKYWMKVFSDQHFKRTQRLLSGGQAMAQAYKHLGLDNKLDKQNLAAGAKKTAAPARPRNKVKKASGQKPKFTDAQLAMAKSMGKDEKWLAQNAK